MTLTPQQLTAMTIAGASVGLPGQIAAIAAKMGLSLLDAAGFQFSRVESAATDLRQAIENAQTKDANEANSIWAHLGSVLRNGLDYAAERQRFNGEVDALKAYIEEELTLIEAEVARVKGSAAKVPDNLDQSSSTWRGVSSKMNEVEASIQTLKGIEGWSGEASGRYGDTATVQGAATVELSAMAGSVASSLTAIGDLNRAIFMEAQGVLGDFVDEIGTYPGGSGGEFYVRSSTVAQRIKSVRLMLVAVLAGDSVKAAAAELSSQVNQTLNSPSLLAPGTWPSGGAQAGVPPTPGDGVRDPEVDPWAGRPDECYPPAPGIHD